MTFAARTFQGMSNGILSWTGTLGDLRTTPAACNGSVAFNPNGTTTPFGNLSSVPARWTDATGTPGSNVWLRWTDNTGKAATGGFLQNTIYHLNVSCLLQWSAGSGPYGAVGTATVNFYGDSGATQLLGTITLNVDVESS